MEVDLIPFINILVLFQCIAKLLLGQKASVLKYSNPTKWFITVLTSSPLKSYYKGQENVNANELESIKVQCTTLIIKPQILMKIHRIG